MYIWSQDKRTLGNFEIFRVDKNGKHYEISAFKDGMIFELGQYDSEFKTLEIIKKLRGFTSNKVETNQHCFKMPQDRD